MRIANTDASCAICPRVGCNHELFCAAGHFSFVLWLLKTGRQKIHLVWKTALLLSTAAPCQQWNSLFSFCVWHPSLSLSFSFLDLQSKKKKKLPENLQSLDLYDLCGGDTKLVGVGLVLLYFGLLLALTVAKNGQFCSHAHGNLILDIWSAVIRALHRAPELPDCHLQTNESTLVSRCTNAFAHLSLGPAKQSSI